jgi:hypothetical protein
MSSFKTIFNLHELKIKTNCKLNDEPFNQVNLMLKKLIIG